MHQFVFAQDLDKLRGNPAAVMSVIDEWMSSHGHMMTFKPSKVEVALEVLIQSKPKTVVELGTYVGFSALAWGKMMKDFHSDLTGCKVVTMELSEEFANITSDFIKLAGLDDVVKVVQGQSATSLRQLAKHGIDSIDYLFIDHWEKYYLSDLKLCEELDLLHPGSIIVADNTDMPGAPDYLEYVQGGGSGKYRYLSRTCPTQGEKGKPVSL